MTEKHCVYTVLTGRYEELLEQPTAQESEVDHICFTDDVELSSSSWEIRTFDLPFPADPARSSRIVKILGDRFLPEYESSLYIDNSVLLRRKAEDVFDDLLPAGASMAAIAHSYRSTVEDEFTAVIEEGYERSFIVREQLEHYRLHRPEVLSQKPVWAGLLLRRHHDPQLQLAMETWWWHILRYSKRDQLSMMAALTSAQVEPVVHQLDNFESPYHEWPRDGGRDRSSGSRLLGAAAIHASTPDGSPAESEELRSMISDLIRQLERQKQVIDDLETENAHRLRVIDDLNEETAHRQKVIDEVAAEAAHRQNVIDDLAAEAAHRLNIIEEVSKMAEQRLESLTEMTRERDELTLKLNDLRGAIESIPPIRWWIGRKLGGRG